MDKKHEALRLAGWIQEGVKRQGDDDIAAELCRLQKVNTSLLEALESILDEPNQTMSDSKALKEMVKIARLAIAKGQE
jgi:hypothetical protein